MRSAMSWLSLTRRRAGRPRWPDFGSPAPVTRTRRERPAGAAGLPGRIGEQLAGQLGLAGKPVEGSNGVPARTASTKIAVGQGTALDIQPVTGRTVTVAAGWFAPGHLGELAHPGNVGPSGCFSHHLGPRFRPGPGAVSGADGRNCGIADEPSSTERHHRERLGGLAIGSGPGRFLARCHEPGIRPWAGRQFRGSLRCSVESKLRGREATENTFAGQRPREPCRTGGATRSAFSAEACL